MTKSDRCGQTKNNSKYLHEKVKKKTKFDMQRFGVNGTQDLVRFGFLLVQNKHLVTTPTMLLISLSPIGNHHVSSIPTR